MLLQDLLEGAQKRRRDTTIPASFSSLPPEVKLKILAYLSPSDRLLRASLVCSEWKTLCEDPHLWKEDLTITRIFVSHNDGTLFRILTKFPLLKKLVFFYLARSDNPGLDICHGGLEVTETVVVQSSDAVSTRFASGKSSIRLQEMTHWEGNTVQVYGLGLASDHLDISVPRFFDSNVYLFADSRICSTDSEVQMLLSVLDKRYIKGVVAYGMLQDHSYDLLAGCCNMVSVELCLSQEGISERNLVNGLGALRNLTYLTLSFDSCDSSPSSEAFQAFFSGPVFPNLLTLSITKAPGLDDTCSSLIVSSCPSLRDLYLNHTNVTAIGLRTIVSGCDNLKKVYVKPLCDEQNFPSDILMISLMRPNLVVVFWYRGRHESVII